MSECPGAGSDQGERTSDTSASDSESGQGRLCDRIAYCIKENNDRLQAAKGKLYNILGSKPLGSSIPQWIDPDMKKTILQWRDINAKRTMNLFENKQMGYNFNTCANCHEAILCNNQAGNRQQNPHQEFVCFRCAGCENASESESGSRATHSRKKRKSGPGYSVLFSAEKNNSCPCDVPVELQGLSEAEEMLIARIQPLIRCTHLKGGVLSMSGHTCGYYQDATPMLNVLPRIPAEVTEVSCQCTRQTPLSSHCLASQSSSV